MGMMVLSGLKPLYAEMISKNICRSKFSITYNGISASTVFVIDAEPMVMAFGVIAKNIYFQLEIGKDLSTGTFFNGAGRLYQTVIEAFEIGNSRSKEKFMPRHFLEHINRNFPAGLENTAQPRPRDMAMLYPHVDEAEKIYFVGFLDNSIRGHRVTAGNLEKTLRLMGRDAHDMCRSRNFSTRWSADPRDDDFDDWINMVTERQGR